MGYFDEETFKKTTAEDILGNDHNEFIACNFESIDFSSISLRNQSFRECNFSNCNLSNIETIGSTFKDSTFVNCKLIGVNWSNCNSFERICIKDSILNYSIFQSMKLRFFECTNSTANEVDFAEADLEGSNFSGSNLRHTSFNSSNLTKANFKAASEYTINPNFTKIKKAKFDLPEAIALLQAFDIELN